jgi:nitroimidazol reductase NimA-like FMN-containing flavoprotein (pyridoxamine 5'-phosphate oxidase superfamily)
MSAPEAEPDPLRAFLQQHHTLVIATEADGQPWCTRVFFAETFGAETPGDDALPTFYAMTKTPSRKLTNLATNARVGLFVGPDFPTAWLEARGTATMLADPGETQAARDLVLAKSPEAGPFLARVTAVAVRIEVGWLRLTDAATDPRRVVERGA